ncbi:hypothetical protein MIND_01280900 [Mycena indigotica]|uniref:Uncharacterized protein n=1 Tax=Mycena indigotica TaxID=2126181 RepID=A0A8H6S1T8_9AGAR|nr:uncharacterized protein MIND_01280900 [Mycena indigotica]KAF7291364.1 hypothetical protein MIND_01280900 [Mycena indigotica]
MAKAKPRPRCRPRLSRPPSATVPEGSAHSRVAPYSDRADDMSRGAGSDVSTKNRGERRNRLGGPLFPSRRHLPLAMAPPASTRDAATERALDEEFTRITSCCYYRAPTGRARREVGREAAPDLVMILGWAYATLRPVSHYSRKYAEMYPGAAQLVLTCDTTAFGLGTFAMNIARMRPVVNFLHDLFRLEYEGEAPKRWMVQCMSSGGLMQLHWLTLTLNHLHNTGALHPASINSPHRTLLLPALPPLPTLTILDSAPSVADISEFWEGAGYYSVRRLGEATALYYANRTLAVCGLRPELSAFIGDFVAGEPEGDITLMAGAGGATARYAYAWHPLSRTVPRVYFYSDVDRVALLPRVKAHIAQMRATGVPVVREEFFRGTAHVSHARRYPERYWRAVAGAWRAACTAGKNVVEEAEMAWDESEVSSGKKDWRGSGAEDLQARAKL